MNLHVLAATIAATDPNEIVAKRTGALGLLGGIIVTAIVIATIVLMRGMNKRIKHLPPNFDDVPEAEQRPAKHHPEDPSA